MLNGVKIGARLMIGFGVVVVLFAAIAGFQILQMQRLGKIQDAGAGRARDLALVKDVEIRVAQAYTVMADAIINRNVLTTNKEWADLKSKAKEDIESVKTLADTDAERKGAEGFAEAYDAYLALFGDKILPTISGEETDEQRQTVRSYDDQVDKLRTAAVAALTPVSDSLEKEMTQGDEAFDFTRSETMLISAILSVLGLAVAMVIAFLISRSISRPLSKGVIFAQVVAGGDFTQRLDVRQKDEVGALAQALNGMSAKLKEMVEHVQENALQVASSSEEISASAMKLSEGAQGQASTLEETSASMEELTASVDQVAEHAQSQAAGVQQGTASMSQVTKSIEEVSANLNEISALARKSVDNAVEGARAVQQVVVGINLIAESSEKIGGIVEVISDIADQTNLLALNASIEAARAGEHGRGFAVVADEVSKLADRSASSTKEIESLIRESAKSVIDGVKTAMGSQSAMEQIRDASQKVRDMIGGLSESMSQQVAAVHQLASALESVSEMSQSISAATEEQTTNAKQVSKAVESVNDLTQSAASAAEEMSAATEQLSSMAQELQRLMAQFKVGNGSQEQAHIGGNGNGNSKIGNSQPKVLAGAAVRERLRAAS